jgi:hypothetical protein
MMKARKPKRYAEGGNVDSAGNSVEKQTPMKLVMPGADYRPGVSGEHRYFQPDTQKIEANAIADAASAASAASAAPVDINANTSASTENPGNAKGGVIKLKKMAKGGVVKSSRGDGCAMKGKTKGRMV